MEPSVGGEGIVVVSLGAPVFMKLLAGRKRDLADITELVKAGVDLGAVKAYLTSNAPDRLEELEGIVVDAEAEEP